MLRRALLALSLSLAAAGPAVALELQRHEVVAERDAPEICFAFDQDLAQQRNLPLADFVKVEPEVRHSAAARGSSLCVGGFRHGERYAVTVRDGLPAKDGSRLAAAQRFEVFVPDRSPALRFRESGYVLPRSEGRGLPVVAVNVARARLAIYRINDRNLLAELKNETVGRSVSRYVTEDIAQERGEEVWSGSFEVGGERNRPVTKVLPVGEVLRTLGPGIYVAQALPPDAEKRRWEDQATQWFVVSDVGLASFRAGDGLLVQARTLGSAEPRGDVEVSLIAADNGVLAVEKSDAEGFVRFPAGLLRGKGGRQPRALYAAAADGDFTFLDLGRPELDLGDRDIGGRAPPGPLDGFLFAERGIYRPGERLHVGALLRDERARAVVGLPLTFRLLRPDGEELLREAVRDTDGGYAWTVRLPATAPGGSWTVLAHADPNGPPVGRTEVQVGDFVPPQIEVAVESAATAVAPGGTLPAKAKVDYLYGAPAADLGGSATVTLRAVADPFPAFAGFRFGLAQEPFLPVRQEPLAFVTDQAGEAALDLALPPAPDTTQPLEAHVEVTAFDLAGRPVASELALPYRHRPFHIGIRPLFDGAVPDGGTARFEVLAVDAAGARAARPGLQWTAYREERIYTWYRDGEAWRYEVSVLDQRIGGGDVDLAADRPATLEVPVGWGEYRIEVTEKDGPVASSVRFDAGWGAGGESERPDQVRLSLDKPLYARGETARLRIEAPYAAQALVLVADETLRLRRMLPVGRDGATVELPVGPDWTAGAYVLVHAYGRAADVGGPLPRRAVGVAWLPVDARAGTLETRIEAPEQATPSATVEVAVALDGMAGRTAHVMLAAVDDGVLQLTGYKAPDPVGFYHGRRALALAQHDLWGALIDSTGDSLAELRSGGDGAFAGGLAGMPDRNTEVVSLFSGIVAVGPDGRARVPLALPDFNGRLRLMAVAWNAEAVGRAEATVQVRAPVVAELTLPRFLAPDDEATLQVRLHNLAGPAGAYRVRLATEGPVALDRAELQAAALAVGDERRERLTLKATGAGRGVIRLAVEGPDGFALARERTISVRPPSAPVSRRYEATLAPGQRLALDPGAFAEFRPETVSGSVEVSPVPGLDVPALVARLDGYPYGCVEQTTSKASGLLAALRLGEAFAIAGADARRAAVQQAIYRLAAMQAPEGGYGLWGPGGETWLTAYVMDFLGRARQAGLHVPDSLLKRGYDWLQTRLDYLPPVEQSERLEGQAYAHYVLASAGLGRAAELRYLYETRWRGLRTPIARAQLAVALAKVGERERAGRGLAAAEAAEAPAARGHDYGSPLRDRAALVALAAEAGAAEPAALLRRFEAAAELYRQESYPNTQEMLWLVLAAEAATGAGEPMRLEVDGQARPPSATPFRAVFRGAGDALPQVRNAGGKPVYQSLTVTGVPAQPLPAERKGMVLRRQFFDMQGGPLNLDAVRQNDTFVVVLEGEAGDGVERQLMLSHLLPAGWELEDTRLDGAAAAERLPWLGELSEAERLELRDDRFLAAVETSGDRRGFRVAFVARAVTPGSFALPGGHAEDMYRPSVFARQAVGRIAVQPR